MQIALRLPGPVSTGATQSDTKPGTNWGIVNNINVGLSAPNNEVFGIRDPFETHTIDTTNKIVTIPLLFGSNWRLFRTFGVILLRIVMNKDWGKSPSDFTSPGWGNVSNSSPGVIKKIELLQN